MYEELINSEEISRTYESKNFFIVFPNFYKNKKIYIHLILKNITLKMKLNQILLIY